MSFYAVQGVGWQSTFDFGFVTKLTIIFCSIFKILLIARFKETLKSPSCTLALQPDTAE